MAQRPQLRGCWFSEVSLALFHVKQIHMFDYRDPSGTGFVPVPPSDSHHSVCFRNRDNSQEREEETLIIRNYSYQGLKRMCIQVLLDMSKSILMLKAARESETSVLNQLHQRFF